VRLDGLDGLDGLDDLEGLDDLDGLDDCSGTGFGVGFLGVLFPGHTARLIARARSLSLGVTISARLDGLEGLELQLVQSMNICTPRWLSEVLTPDRWTVTTRVVGRGSTVLR
jgi:hypothetical protein